MDGQDERNDERGTMNDELKTEKQESFIPRSSFIVPRFLVLSIHVNDSCWMPSV